MGKAAKTGMEPVALSAMEALLPKEQRLFHDPLAYSFLPPSMKAYLWLCRWPVIRNWIIKTSESMLPGAYAGILARKIYMEKKFRENCSGVSNVVELGAGFDTFSLRLRGRDGQNFFELDFPGNIQTKAKILDRQHLSENEGLCLCAIDFDRDSIGDVLSEHGFTQKNTFVVWEGVTPYLTEQGLRRTFQWLETLPRDSLLAFTYINDEFIKGKNLMGWEAAYKKYVKGGVWKTGFSVGQLPGLLRSCGWKLQEDLSASEILPAELLRKRRLKTSGVERMAFAIKL